MMTKGNSSSDLFSQIMFKRTQMSAIRDYPVGCGPRPVGFGMPAKKAQKNARIGNTKVKLMGLGKPADVGLVGTVDEHNPRSSRCFSTKEIPDVSTDVGSVNHLHQKFVSATRAFPRNSRCLSTREDTVEIGVSRNRALDAEHKESFPRASQNNPSSSSSEVGGAREKVRETLRLFQAIFRQLSHEQHGKREDATDFTRRMDYKTWTVLKNKGKHVNRGKIIGNVAGIEIGDEFQYKAELSVVGLHRAMRGGIDYMKRGDVILTTSIVSSGSHNDELEKDVVVYTGQGGNVEGSNKRAEDQRLVKGNLALSNSMRYKTPVRVIRGEVRGRGKGKIYVYDGLYLVEEIWREMGPRDKLVFKFKLRRMSGQPHLR